MFVPKLKRTTHNTKIMIISRNTTVLPILLILTTLFSTITLSVANNNDGRISREEYIKRYKKIAIYHQILYGIPASITMAQGILESDSGNSTLARGSNNHFGIKCKSDWKGKTFTHTDDAPNECFRAYKSVEDSYEDHAKFLDESPRYDSLFSYRADDYHSWARGLKAAGYATAPDYATRLIKIIEDNKLYLLDSSDGLRRLAKISQQERRNKTASIETLYDPNEITVSVNARYGYDLQEANGTMYIVSSKNDTYSNLAKRFGISPSRLRKFNDKARGVQEIAEGSVVYLERKGRKWKGTKEFHQLATGESMHSVSQMYGIREKRLYRLNGLEEGDKVKVGDIIHIK